MKDMKKYLIGLGVIVLLSLGLTIFVLMQGVNGKQDTQTDKKAREVVTKLNSYTTNNQKLPDNLSQLGVQDIPSTITYNKVSASEYSFCVTYKTASQLDVGGIENIVAGTAAQSLGQQDSSSYDSSSSDYQSAYLYLPYSHKKGKNCQSVKPYMSSSSYNSYSSSTAPSSLYNSAYSSSSSSFANSASDTERQTDIKALYSQTEAYYAQDGHYPTLANLNDTTWRATNMKGLDKEALRDPNGASYLLVSSPTKGYYSYSAESSSGGTCDNKTSASECVAYTLTATLSNGQQFTKYNLN